MKWMKAPRAWLLDLDGTLYHPLPMKLLLLPRLLGLSREQLRIVRSFRREHELMRELGVTDAGTSPYAVQLARTAAALGMTEDRVAQVVSLAMIELPLPFLRPTRRRGLLDELVRFREGGGKTALVSDYPARKKLAALGAEVLFDTVVANGEPGGPAALKPSPSGYLLAAERLKVDPTECLVIGDRDDADGAAARAAQMAFRRVGW